MDHVPLRVASALARCVREGAFHLATHVAGSEELRAQRGTAVPLLAARALGDFIDKLSSGEAPEDARTALGEAFGLIEGQSGGQPRWVDEREYGDAGAVDTAVTTWGDRVRVAMDGAQVNGWIRLLVRKTLIPLPRQRVDVRGVAVELGGQWWIEEHRTLVWVRVGSRTRDEHVVEMAVAMFAAAELSPGPVTGVIVYPGALRERVVTDSEASSAVARFGPLLEERFAQARSAPSWSELPLLEDPKGCRYCSLRRFCGREK